MHKMPPVKFTKWSILLGVLVGLLAMAITVLVGGAQSAQAAPVAQDATPHPTVQSGACKDCHLDIEKSWQDSAHAHAFDDQVFQEQWSVLGKPGSCLSCHTTNYQASTNQFSQPGVACEACHGTAPADHPPAVVPVKADTEYCGTCHTTTLQEWRQTGHAQAGVGCMSCHDPHSQKGLFAVSDNLCINCHKEDMERYLEDIHVKKGIGCVDCHKLVIPPETPPQDGIVPTGHTFTITPQTCVACHTDSLHAGFKLPGYEHGAKAASSNPEATPDAQASQEEITSAEPVETGNTGMSAEQRIQALEAALASGRLSTLFQGGVIGLVLGGTTAWLVANNARRTPVVKGDEEETEEEAGDEQQDA